MEPCISSGRHRIHFTVTCSTHPPIECDHDLSLKHLVLIQSAHNIAAFQPLLSIFYDTAKLKCISLQQMVKTLTVTCVTCPVWTLRLPSVRLLWLFARSVADPEFKLVPLLRFTHWVLVKYWHCHGKSKSQRLLNNIWWVRVSRDLRVLK